jgi:hypothetical protein
VFCQTSGVLVVDKLYSNPRNLCLIWRQNKPKTLCFVLDFLLILLKKRKKKKRVPMQFLVMGVMVQKPKLKFLFVLVKKKKKKKKSQVAHLDYI